MARMQTVYLLVKDFPRGYHLPRQARQIVEILEEKKQCTKEDLLAAMEEKVKTVQAQERILVYYQGHLVNAGFMEFRRVAPGEVIPEVADEMDTEATLNKTPSIKEVLDEARSNIAAISGVEESQVRLTLTL